MSFDDYIFVTPGFLRGAARALDIGGILGQDAFVLSRSGSEADQRAIASDFRVMARDLNGALETVQSEMTTATVPLSDEQE